MLFRFLAVATPLFISVSQFSLSLPSIFSLILSVAAVFGLKFFLVPIFALALSLSASFPQIIVLV